ncbi:MAG: hypothetical protein GY925_26780 [Actinomycetia bacterium]|nr:hypothetical protein [Actinomycetes bacterium]
MSKGNQDQTEARPADAIAVLDDATPQRAHLRWLLGGLALAVVAGAVWLLSIRDTNEPEALSPTSTPTSASAPASSGATTSTSTRPLASSGGLLPDPWSADDRFECRNGGTGDLAECAGYDLNAANANLRVTIEVLARGRDLPELRDTQQDWEHEVTRLCQLSEGGGSSDRYNTPWCLAAATNMRAQLLEVFDPATDFPDNPVDLWQTPITVFETGCETRLIGQLVGDPHGAVLSTARNIVELQLGEQGTVTGVAELEVTLETADGTRHSVSSTAALHGHRAGDVAAGVFTDQTIWDNNDPEIGYGYWWIELDQTGHATGEMIALFDANATSTLELQQATC